MTNSIKAYLVGGFVRDRILGKASKDYDYAVVAPSYDAMVNWIKGRGKVFIEKPEYLTVRAKLHGGGESADFVLCRKDGAYADGRRPDSVEPGTIYDDLARRDFTMNAIAMDDETGKYIDPHGGYEDIGKNIIRCVGDARQRFAEDALRMLRALRFSITKNMIVSSDIYATFDDDELTEKLRTSVSVDRKREELTKAFAADTVGSMKLLLQFPKLTDACFNSSKLWLMPTTRA